jgi:hypothetical protein
MPSNIFVLSAVAANVLWRFALAARFGHNVAIAVFLHPLSVLLLIAIGINSWYLSKFRAVAWKGRDIKIRPGRI